MNKGGRPATVKWQPSVAYVGRVLSQDRELVFTIVPDAQGNYWAVGVESCAGIPKTKLELDHVLADHAHKNFGKFPTLSRAVGACQRYARKWKRGRASLEACECDDITAGGNPIRAHDP